MPPTPPLAVSKPILPVLSTTLNNVDDSSSLHATISPSTTLPVDQLSSNDVEKHQVADDNGKRFESDYIRACSPCHGATLTSAEARKAELPFSTILLAHIGAAMSLFLATTDATIVSTSLPTIASQLQGTQTEYNWVGVVYLLTQTACQPFWGTLTALMGRKVLFYLSISIFMIGSLMCGVAKNMTWLISARAVAGIGAGGIVTCAWVSTAQLVPPESRPRWSQALSVTWSCSAVAGPLISGALSDGSVTSSRWRWAFLVNLPIGAVSMIILYFALRKVELERPAIPSLSGFMQTFDAVGLLLFLCSTVVLVFGFSFAAQYGWTSALILTAIIFGFLCFILGIFYECRTNREPLFPPIIFTQQTLRLTLFIVFFHSFVFNSGTFFLSLYYQAVNGYTPFESGLSMLPYSLGSSLASMPSAWIISFWQQRTHNVNGQKAMTLSGLLLATIGFGIMILLNVNTSTSVQETAPLLAGIGVGMLFHAPYQIYADALEPGALASATGAFFMIRFMGSTIGLAICGAILDEGLSQYLPTAFSLQTQGSSIDFRGLSSLQPLNLKQEVLTAVAKAIRNIWITATPCLGAAILVIHAFALLCKFFD